MAELLIKYAKSKITIEVNFDGVHERCGKSKNRKENKIRIFVFYYIPANNKRCYKKETKSCY